MLDWTNDESGSQVTVEIAPMDRVESWAVEIQDGAGVRSMPVPPAGLVVGSSRSCDLRVDDPTVSGKHCVVQRLGGGLVVRDTGSKNGTFAGGARVAEAWGVAGATMTIGQTTLAIVATRAEREVSEPDCPPLPGVAGASRAMRDLARRVRRLARHSAPVLVSAETGCGKELVARALHTEGPRRARPFAVLNVATLPRELVESELFGHERGAFTGAVASRRGAFAAAEGGTLFLDEIGELPLDAQPKLLRALDGYEVRAVGDQGNGRAADVRVIAATHVPLEERVLAGTFRRDLFHRIEVLVVRIPPLRERRGDVGPIARKLLARAEPEIGPRQLAPAALARLVAHDWPGNVRELRNVLLRAADCAGEARLIGSEAIAHGLGATTRAAPGELSPSLAKAWLREHDGNVSLAARAANMPRSSFRKLVSRAK